MNTNDIRQLFIRFFAERGHRQVPSSSLIPPPEERTLLFTNAGMNQMKPYFMGLAEPPARRLTSIQKCFRTSDIEEVGDGSHHTFFEMLGNFSVGDYFKREVIPWAWELLTSPQPQGLGLSKDRLWATVYLDDDESFDLWRSVGIPAERIIRFDESENYWFMIKGGAGPCGPNTEIYYDYGADQGCGRPDCAPPTHDCGRFIELWNLVFMTLFQEEDGKTRRPLPMTNVDTGAGLERWPGPLLWEGGTDWQGRPRRWTKPPTNYDSDLFQPILARIQELSGSDYEGADEAGQRAMRIVAEHTRAATFLIADGVTPSNEGRGYVLRRLIRRGTNFGQRLKQGQQFLEATSQAVIDLMAGHYPNLGEQARFVLETLRSEERRFFDTLWQGRSQLEEFKRASAATKQIRGADVFQLWDTHGFPPELTLELLAEDGFTVADPETFEALMEEQRQRSRAAARFEGDVARVQTYAELGLQPTEFLGYETTRAFASVVALLVEGRPVREASAPAGGVEVVLAQTPFYAEGGGQVGDRGEIVWPGGRFVVEDTQAVGEGGVIAHIGRLESGSLAVGDPVEARVDESLRADTMRNHTATHILHAALRKVLGTHVRQAGSLVAPDRLRFDFTHMEALTPEQIRQVEALANRVVRDNVPVHVDHQRYEEAIAGGALAFFGEKYADVVRVVGVCYPEDADPEPGQGCFSRELCGGTHVHASGDVGAIVITSESSIGAGLRRLEAVTGRAAIERMRIQEERLQRLSARLRVPPEGLEQRVEALSEELERLRREAEEARRRSLKESLGERLAAEALDVSGVKVVIHGVESAPNVDALRVLGDDLRRRLGTAFVLLGAVIAGKPSFVGMATPDVARRCPAGDVVRAVAQAAGGSGGGRPESAQGGATDPSKLEAALAAGRRLIEEKLST